MWHKRGASRELNTCWPPPGVVIDVAARDAERVVAAVVVDHGDRGWRRRSAIVRRAATVLRTVRRIGTVCRTRTGRSPRRTERHGQRGCDKQDVKHGLDSGAVVSDCGASIGLFDAAAMPERSQQWRPQIEADKAIAQTLFTASSRTDYKSQVAISAMQTGRLRGEPFLWCIIR